MKLHIFLLFVINFFITVCFAQRDLNLFAARKLSEQGFYYEAREKYEAAIAKDTGSEILVEYADLLFFSLADYGAAYAPILKCITPGDTAFVHYYCLAKCEQFLEKYSLAEIHYNKLLNAIGRKKRYKDLRTEAEVNLRSIEFAKKNSANSNVTRMRVVNAGKNVNTQYEEYVPVVDEKENFLLFTSRRKNKHNKSVTDEEGRYAEDMYVAVRDGNSFTPAELLPSGFNSTQDIQNSGRNESLVSMSHDGNTLFLYKEGTLWRSDLVNGKWTLPVLLDKKIIEDDYDNHISITADGKTVYFTGERKGGVGGTDIYRCVKNDDGSWSAPENLGKRFNTKGNEQSPFISSDGRRLYFSSNSMDGFGGYDVYVSEFDGKEWSEPRNMGLPVNSSADDIFFYPNDNGTEGYFSSNRKGAVGGFDIFRFYYLDKPSFGNKSSRLTAPAQNLKEEEMYSFIKNEREKNQVSKIFFRINDSIIIEDHYKLAEYIKPGTDSKIEMQVIYECDTCFYRDEKMYAYNVTGEDPEPAGKTEAPEFMSSEVFFADNSARIDVKFLSSLDTLAMWLKQHPEAAVSVYGYADKRGSYKYNKSLSEKRAEAVVAYLNSKNVGSSQILEKEGRGEVQEDELARNRRVEIDVVTQKLAQRTINK